MESDKRERASNIELFRIVAMLLIIAHHYFVCSGLGKHVAQYPTSMRTLFLILFGMWGKMGTDCFVLITGYFMCKAKVRWEKFWKLVFAYEFYKVIEYSIFILRGTEKLSRKEIIKIILPISDISSNFMDCYLVFFLFIPFLNILVQNMTEKEHRRLAFLCIGAYSIFAAISENYIKVTLNMVQWFICLYIVASYIRLYPRQWFDKTKVWVMASGVVVLLTMADAVYRQLHGLRYGWYVYDCNKPLAFLTALCLFMLFRNLKIPQSKIINALAASCFGVLLIHSGTSAMRNWLWEDAARNVEHFFSPYLPIHAILWTCLVFFLCVPIDMLYKRVVEEPVFRWWNRRFWES